jgi:hypothetical protein
MTLVIWLQNRGKIHQSQLSHLASTSHKILGGKHSFDLDIYGESKTRQQVEFGKSPGVKKKGKDLAPARDSASWNLFSLSNDDQRGYLVVPRQSVPLIILDLRHGRIDKDFQLRKSEVEKSGKNFVNDTKNYGLRIETAPRNHKYILLPANTRNGVEANRTALVNALNKGVPTN